MNTIYVVTEVKTVANSDAVLIESTQHSSLSTAESRYHSRLSAAALSEYPKHAVFLLTNDGIPMEAKCYTHEVIPAQATE